LETYVKVCCRGTTYSGYETSIRLYLNPSFGAKRLDEIRRADVKEFVFGLAKKSLSTSTVLNIKACLGGILTNAIEDEIISSNPAARFGKYIKRESKPEVDFLTREEAAHLVDTLKEHFPHYYPLFLCALRTGMRIGELFGLEWGDVDFNGHFIKVQRACVRGNVGTTKNGKPRRVDMSAQLAEVLKALRTDRRREALRQGKTDISGRVFLTKNDTPMISAIFAEGSFNAVSKRQSYVGSGSTTCGIPSPRSSSHRKNRSRT
jgi:integrase